jgi:glycosyltransferase involved in cell wall biosynthesis
VPAADPLVSVLLPARDAARTLDLSLKSVARQSFSDFECVVVDNGSCDSTSGVARAFGQGDARFRLIGEPERGIVPALNAGIAECRGRFVARMDADDVMHRQRLASQVAMLQARSELTAVGCHVRLFPRRILTDGMRAYERWLNAIDSPARLRAEAFVECPIAHPTLMIRKDVLAEHRYRDRGWPEDYDLVLRLLRAGHELGVVPRRLLGWRDGPARLSRTAPEYASDRITACKAAFLCETFLRDATEYVLWGYGDTGRVLSRALSAHGKKPAHIVELHPGRIGQRIAGARVISPSELGSLPRRPLIVSVAGATPRSQIRSALFEMGYEDTVDFVCAA